MPVIEFTPASGSLLVGNTIDAGHFGTNYLFNRESFDENIGSGAFDETATHLGISHLRYPGGTIAETQFDLANPDNTLQATNLLTGGAIPQTAQHRLTPLSDFLTAAAAMDAQVTVVLPTARYLDAIQAGGSALTAVEAEVKAFIVWLMDQPQASNVEMLEIGNEYAALGLTPAEYGQIANLMIQWVAEALDAAPGPDPEIGLQTSPRAARLNETQTIVNQLSNDAKAEVDAVILHNYRPTPWEQANTTAGKFDHATLVENMLGRELTRALTEWNVGNASPNDGLLQGAGMLEMFNQHAREGVDIAHIWPLFENNSTRLAADVTDPDEVADLMIGGEIFRQMSTSLRGAQVVNIDPNIQLDGDAAPDALIHAYASGTVGGAVLFVSSLEATSMEVTLDLSAIAGLTSGAQDLWITRTGVAEGVDPTSASATPVVHSWAADAAEAVTLTLGAHEILRLEYSGTGLPVTVLRDADGVQDFRLNTGSEIVVLGDDGDRDLVRDFQVGIDRLDISALGIAEFSDLQIVERLRSDGSVSWIEVQDRLGGAEVALRFADGPLNGDRLEAESFIFAAEAAPGPIDPGGPDGIGFDDIRATDAGEVFRLADDGVRDLLRGFELGQDLLDVSLWGAVDIADLDIVNLVRKSGTVSWVQISDRAGEAELAIRFTGAPLDAENLTAAHFVFADEAGPPPETPRVVDGAGFDDLRGKLGAEVFQMADDGIRDVVRGFELGVDQLDLRALGAEDMSDITLTDIRRKDGSVNWIEVRDASGEAEFLLRFWDTSSQSASQLTADDIIFV
ncbi:MAG: hypothetical protein AAGH68_00955 [Pseudomonadota bacterium]